MRSVKSTKFVILEKRLGQQWVYINKKLKIHIYKGFCIIILTHMKLIANGYSDEPGKLADSRLYSLNKEIKIKH